MIHWMISLWLQHCNVILPSDRGPSCFTASAVASGPETWRDLLRPGDGNSKISDAKISMISSLRAFSSIFEHHFPHSNATLEVLSVVSTQYKSVLDAIRINSKTFLFVDEVPEGWSDKRVEILAHCVK